MDQAAPLERLKTSKSMVGGAGRSASLEAAESPSGCAAAADDDGAAGGGASSPLRRRRGPRFLPPGHVLGRPRGGPLPLSAGASGSPEWRGRVEPVPLAAPRGVGQQLVRLLDGQEAVCSSPLMRVRMEALGQPPMGRLDLVESAPRRMPRMRYGSSLGLRAAIVVAPPSRGAQASSPRGASSKSGTAVAPRLPSGAQHRGMVIGRQRPQVAVVQDAELGQRLHR